ncbi:hypothetical protein FV242_31395 [Methylobacterium sp. WL64]|uniref:hypothetical protein n=1 Tax=Methylobacterium sp. WL64 TaxID=2603894 RepID=UPI0011CC5763|nr:hypothetical protein [Methylobacterium sp. WL64]TXM97508.1 hypothetical protein FV242_31395 [Methylobacterium sp. WL64]
MTSFSEIIARAIRALIAAVLALFGGAKEAAATLVEDGRQIGRAARGIGEATARLVGKGLAGPARILDRLANATGSLLPRGTAGPKQIADAAVEHDHVGYQIPAATKAAMTEAAMAGNRVSFAATARARGDADMAASLDADLPPHVKSWLDTLSPKQIAAVAAMDVFHIQAHVEGRSLADGLPPVPAQPKAVTGRAEMQAALAEIRRIARAERAAEVERATGGHRRPVLPAEDDADYAPVRAGGGMRPAFH